MASMWQSSLRMTTSRPTGTNSSFQPSMEIFSSFVFLELFVSDMRVINCSERSWATLKHTRTNIMSKYGINQG